MMSPAGEEHGSIANQIAFLLTRYVRKHRLGRVYAAETGFRIASAPDTVRAPDVAFISAARLDTAPAKSYRKGAPDLAVEVLSPDDAPGEVRDKVQDWLRAGAKQVWVVSPAQRTVAIHRLDAPAQVFENGALLMVDDLLPGLRLRVAEVFA